MKLKYMEINRNKVEIAVKLGKLISIYFKIFPLYFKIFLSHFNSFPPYFHKKQTS